MFVCSIGAGFVTNHNTSDDLEPYANIISMYNHSPQFKNLYIVQFLRLADLEPV